MQEYGIYIGIGTLVAIIVGVVSGAWKLYGTIVETRDRCDAMIENIERDVANQGKETVRIDKEMINSADAVRRECGEMGSALRQKVHDVEVFTRDTFVRKDTFEQVVGRLEKFIEKVGDRLEDKIDKAVERLESRVH